MTPLAPLADTDLPPMHLLRSLWRIRWELNPLVTNHQTTYSSKTLDPIILHNKVSFVFII